MSTQFKTTFQMIDSGSNNDSFNILRYWHTKMITSIQVFYELNPIEMWNILKFDSVYYVGFVLNPMLFNLEILSHLYSSHYISNIHV